MFHSHSKDYSAKSNPSNPLAKSHSTSSFDAGSHQSFQHHITSQVTENKHSSSFVIKSPTKSQPSSDTLPYFGNHLRQNTFGTSPKEALNRNQHNDNIYSMRNESSTSPLKSSMLNQNFDIREYSSNKSSNASGNLKQSNSYINAMKALQKKVKGLEEQLYNEKLELESKHKNELELVQLKFEKERRSQQDIENNLRNKLEFFEEELRAREKTIDDLSNEVDKSRKVSYEIESERTNEVQKLVNDKKRLKEQYKELEEKYVQKLKADEELRSKNIQGEYSLREKENEVLELKETISKFEKEKMELNNQFEQKLAEAITKHKLAEEKRRDLEIEFQEELKRRFHQFEEIELENRKLKSFIGELEENATQMAKYITEKENEVEDKSLQILKLREEMEVIMREVEKLQTENERTHLYAQDMAQMNQRLLGNMMDKSRASKDLSDFELNQEIQRTHPVQEYQRGLDGSISMDYLQRKYQTEEQLPVYTRVENHRYSKTPRAREGIVSHIRGNSVGSPKHKRGNSYFQGVRFSGEDLSASEMGERRNRPEVRSPQKSISYYDNRNSMNSSKIGPVERIAEMKRNVSRENVDKMELEIIIKEIIEIQKDMLEYNKECQILMNDMIRIDKESPEYNTKKKMLQDIEGRLRDRNLKLLSLKRKEEELMSKSRG